MKEIIYNKKDLIELIKRNASDLTGIELEDIWVSFDSLKGKIFGKAERKDGKELEIKL